MRISKALSIIGVASRRKAPPFLKNNSVVYLDKRITELNYQLNLNKEKVLYINKKKYVIQNETKVILLHKPEGYICSHKKYQEQKIITDLLLPQHKHFFYAGRLDLDSTGLVVLSNNGDLIQKYSHPSFKVKKKYIIKLNKPMKKEDLEHCVKGIYDSSYGEKEHLFFDAISPLSDKNTYQVVLHQGRKREIKRVLESFNYRILTLKRIELAHYKLGDLPIGKFKEITSQK